MSKIYCFKLKVFLLVAFSILTAWPISCPGQVINYENDPDLAKALEYDLELNGGDLEKGNRALAEEYYLAYLKKATDSFQKARVYAQLGALYANAINPKLGEKPDYEKSIMYFEKVLEMEPERIGRPTICARMMRVSPLLSKKERFFARMDSYKWLRSFNDNNIKSLWLPLTPKNTEPTKNQLYKTAKIFAGLKKASETNMISDTKFLPDRELLLCKIIERFPSTPAAELAHKKLDELKYSPISSEPKAAIAEEIVEGADEESEPKTAIAEEIVEGTDEESEPRATIVEEIVEGAGERSDGSNKYVIAGIIGIVVFGLGFFLVKKYRHN